MGALNDELQAALWTEYNAGRMPVALRWKYQTYAAAVLEDSELYELVELRDEGAHYQGLRIHFDPWHGQRPKIETRPIERPA